MHDPWTEKEQQILKKNYPHKTLDELMRLLPNRCDSGIMNKAKRMGFRKSKLYDNR